jgi:hypothetical protein
VASAFSNALEIIDISNPAAPKHFGSLTDGDGGADLFQPMSVYVLGNYAYVTTHRNALEIIDISNPAMPIHKGRFTSSLLSFPLSVTVQDNYAYITSWSNNTLEIVDVTNPDLPVHKGNLTDIGGYHLYGASAVTVLNEYAYVAGGGGTFDIVDVSDPAKPKFTSRTAHGLNGITLDRPLSIFLSQGNVYLPGSRSNSLQIISILKKDQTIDFPALENTVSESVFEINASATSGLSVNFSSDSQNIYIDGNIVVAVEPGQASIKADQPGDFNINAAPTITHTFCVNPQRPNITAYQHDTGLITLVAPEADGYQWYSDGVILLDSVSRRITIKEMGNYTVQIKVDVCWSDVSDQNSLEFDKPDISVFPNPIDNFVNIDLVKFLPNQSYRIEILDSMGKTVVSTLSDGGDVIKMDISQFLTGSYIIRLTDNHKSYLTRFFKK